MISTFSASLSTVFRFILEATRLPRRTVRILRVWVDEAEGASETHSLNLTAASMLGWVAGQFWFAIADSSRLSHAGCRVEIIVAAAAVAGGDAPQRSDSNDRRISMFRGVPISPDSSFRVRKLAPRTLFAF